MKYLYYPGCSPRTSAKSYDTSTRAICAYLDINLEEIEDWNCCGATSYHSLDEIQSAVLSARNLAIAENNNSHPDLITICNACYCNLKRTSATLRHDQEILDTVRSSLAELGLEFQNSVRVRHIIDVMVDDLGEKKIREKITRPLKDLKVVPYYGCQYSKPGIDDNSENQDFPLAMDKLFTWGGAEVLDYPLKTKCCGALLVTTEEEVALKLISRLMDAIPESADCIVTMCPLCQFNLEAYQKRINKKFNLHYNLPVLYFTQLLGHGFGLSNEELGAGRELVSLKRILSG